MAVPGAALGLDLRRLCEALLDCLDDGPETPLYPSDNVLEDGEVQPLLAPEVVADQGLRHGCRFCDRSGACGVKPISAEHSDCRRDERLARRVPAGVRR